MEKANSTHFAPLRTLPPETWIGDPGVLTRPTLLILNSRQNRYPVGDEPWVRQTIAAVQWAAQRDMAVLSSLGMITWELITWASAEAFGDVVVVVGLPPNLGRRASVDWHERIFSDFNLIDQHTCLIPYLESAKPKESWAARDQWLFAHADRIAPVSVRPNGSLAELMDREPFRHRISETFRVPYDPRPPSFPSIPEPDEVHEVLRDLEWDHVVHWTRANAGPWPGETPASFYEALARSRGAYPRDAEATLARILTEQRIRATGWRMPLGRAMTSFSALHPADMMPLMVRQRRFVRMSYEPYGIAIRREVLETIGGQPVRYGPPAEQKTLPAVERLFFQSGKPGGYDWSVEQEWRVKGEVPLDALNPEEALVLVPTLECAKRIREWTSLPVRSLRNA
ncbi:hypothetical protein GF324_08530 [bacterium]|nr:hypothetical protein [bacterium]